MCYSAQVIQMARKLHRQLGLRIDYDEVERLFFRRLDDPGIVISRGFEANFTDPATDQQHRIALLFSLALPTRYGPFGCVGQPTCVHRLDMIVKLGRLPSSPLLRT